MKKLFTIILLLFFMSVKAQKNKMRICESDELHLQQMKSDSKYKEKFDINTADWQLYNKKQQNLDNRAGAVNSFTPTITTLNVVFHDMVTGANPPTAGMLSSDFSNVLDGLNDFYAGNNSGGINTNIQFCLTLQNSQFNPYSDASTWHYTTIDTLHRSDAIEIKNLVINSQSQEPIPANFPTSKFINIYIVDEIFGGISGFATMPSTHGSYIDGIYIKRSSLIGGGMNLKVLAHEMGHYLGLFHVFGICDPTIISNLDVMVGGVLTNPCSCDNNNCLFNGDMVCDTPPSMLLDPSDYTCTINTCHTDALYTISDGSGNNPTIDMNDGKDNIMDYGDDSCITKFTEGQVTRMHFMINPENGPRKSLLGLFACENCAGLEDCSFSIVPNVSLPEPRHEIIQNAIGSIPSTGFNILTSGCSIGIDSLHFEWHLQLLGSPNTQIILSSSSNDILSLPTSLDVGNYKLSVIITLNQNPNCFVEKIYTFSVYPFTPTNSCSLILPNNNSDWDGWNRISYLNGWSRNSIFPYNFTYPLSTRTELSNSATSDYFDIVDPTSFSDANFSSSTAGLSSNVTKIMRVGKIIDGINTLDDGDGSYVTYQFTPTKENCKYRVYYLGMTNSLGSSNPNYFPINSHQNQESWFGFVSRYDFLSPVTSPAMNTSIGNNENGFLVGSGSFVGNNGGQYGLNDMIFGKFNSDLSATSNVAYAGSMYKKMNSWKYLDLDFSEFTDLSTTITLTFFARSNDANPAKAHSYAYFGVECLGGGIPANIEMDFPDVDNQCRANTSASCNQISIPKPNYVINSAQNATPLAWLGAANNLARITVSTSTDNISFSAPVTLSTTSTYNSFVEYVGVLCQTQSSTPYLYFKITLKTLHKTLEDTIKITNSFYHQYPPCNITGPNPIYGGNVLTAGGENVVICPTGPPQILTLSPPCFPPPPGGYKYKWALSIAGNPLGTDETYLVDTDYFTSCASSITRFVQYIDPYCGSPTWYPSQTFNLYNISGYDAFYTAQQTDICVDENFTMNINNFHFPNLNCIPQNLLNALPTSNNSVSLQLLTTSNIPLSTVYTITNPVNNQNYNFSLSFNNIIGNLPIYNVGMHQEINLQITYNFYGCQRVVNTVGNYFNSQFLNVLPSAVGGAISYNCSTGNIINSNSGITGTGLYGWEYSLDGGTNYSTLAATTSYLNNVISLIGSSTFPIYVRRISYGYVGSNCTEPAITTPIVINGNPSNPLFTFPTICKESNDVTLQSSNGFTGTWTYSGTAVTTIDTSAAGTFNYIFTPDAGQCSAATLYTVPITVTDTTVPIFDPIDVRCVGLPSPLQNTSNNLITGEWSPPFNNSESGTYFFTPTSGTCLVGTTQVVTILPAASFNILTNYCLGAPQVTLPTIDQNGVHGNWDIPVVNTSSAGTFHYTFYPQNNGVICEPFVLTVTIHENNANPIFNIPLSICAGTTPPILPTMDINGIVGTWLPSSVNNTISASYIFTPTAGQCALPTTINIIVSPAPCGPTLSWSGEVSCQLGNNDDPREQNSDIVDGPCLRVCENSNIEYTLNVTVGTIDHTDWNVTGGTIIDSSATTCTISWGTAVDCALQGVIFMTDGSTLIINRCIEKINAPIALFGIMPDITQSEYTVCNRSEVIFDNLSTSNNGHETLYYNWNFGDGSTSQEFEPIHTYSSDGSYHVLLQVFNGCSCSSTYEITVNVHSGSLPISCASVACESQVATYSIPDEILELGCNIDWSVQGGNIIGHNSTNTSIDVLWNNIDEDGFGYVSIKEKSCFNCPTIIKIPVVKANGVIKGNPIMCPKTQRLYSLPKWPTTDFVWTIDDHGTGAYLIFNNQRNEVIVNSMSEGPIDIYCTYFNTLLSCGGTAHFAIEVKPEINLLGNYDVCTNTDYTYEFSGLNTPISGIDWIITGPNDFQQSGTSSPFTVAFPFEGIYNIAPNSSDYCGRLFNINVKNRPIAPTGINGPLTICPSIVSTYSCIPQTGSVTHWSVVNGEILGSTVGNSVSIQFNPNASTPYQINVWYENALCTSPLYTMTVFTLVPDLTLLTYDTPVCGSSIGNYSVADVQADSYTWTIEPETAGSVETGQNSNIITVLWNQADVYANLKLTITKCGITYITNNQVHVLNAPAITILGNSAICTGNFANFSLVMTPSGDFDKVVWDFGDGNTETVNYINSSSFLMLHKYEAPITTVTTYTVTATVFGGGGCIMPSSDTFEITVYPTPIVTLESGPGYTFSLNIQNDFSPSTIQWYRNGVLIPGETSSVYTPTDLPCEVYGSRSYYALVTNGYMCTGKSNVIDINCEPSLCNSANAVDFTLIHSSCQQLTANNVFAEGTPLSLQWSTSASSTGTISLENNGIFVVDSISPGLYYVALTATYSENGVLCYSTKRKEVIIPYKARILKTASCDNGTYNVNIISNSLVYSGFVPNTVDYEFTTDNGNTWNSGSVIAGVPQYSANLAPGVYTIGIRLSKPGYFPCIYTEVLTLPNVPDATFTNSIGTCQGSAVSFYPNNYDPESQYEWTFATDVTNLKPYSVRVFDGFNDFPVTLKVTNKYGCTATWSTFVTVIPVDMKGDLVLNSLSACVGDDLVISFVNIPGTSLPVSITWYHNSVDSPPIAVTNSPNLDLTVSQGGQYIAYLTDANGCSVNTTIPISVNFIPTPDTPVLKGPEIICTGNNIQLTVPINTSVLYEWSLNGVVQPQWNNFTTVNTIQTTAGVYNYEVVAKVASGNGNFCYSLPASISVNVIDLPNTPELAFDLTSCSPYVVTVGVSNPQAGISYFWSNGGTGTQTQMYHDGPIEVRAEANGCSVTSQIDLPIDLESVSWVFPKGCFENCEKNPLGYIIGPYGYYNEWLWLQNGSPIQSGTGTVDPLIDAAPGYDYQLLLTNQYCQTTVENLDITEKRCYRCEVEISVEGIDCVEINGSYFYEIHLATYNPSGSNLWSTITASMGEGYFMNSTILIPTGGTGISVYFYPVNGFVSGTVNVEFTFDLNNDENTKCLNVMKMEFYQCPMNGVPIGKKMEITQNLLFAAPNPSLGNTTIFYVYESITSADATKFIENKFKNLKKEIEIYDLLGRKIINLPLSDIKGAIEIDTSAFASGQYIVLLKAEGATVKTAKLIVKN